LDTSSFLLKENLDKNRYPKREAGAEYPEAGPLSTGAQY